MDKKTIWITGGSTGIGKALAIKFAKEGWNVAISARRENLLKETCGEHENISSFPLDVTDKNKCKEVFQNILDTFQNVDICFFSTGTWDPKKEKDIDVEQIENVFKVNFFGTLNSIKAVEKYFKDRKNGEIITVKVQSLLKNGIVVSPGNDDKLKITIKKSNLAKDPENQRIDVFSKNNNRNPV